MQSKEEGQSTLKVQQEGLMRGSAVGRRGVGALRREGVWV